MNRPIQPKGRRVYGTLDGMRGVAAIAVVIIHAPALFGSITAVSAGLAVDLFFVMSGFIIAHAYDARLGATMSVMNFAIIRTIRLYPLYILGLILGAVGAIATIWLGDSDDWTLTLILSAVIPGLFMLPAPGMGRENPPIFPLNPPSWSLFFEMAINIAYAAFFPRLTNKILAALTFGAAVWLAALAFNQGSLNAGSHWDSFFGGFARVSYSFGIGILICRCKHRITNLVQIPSFAILSACAAVFFVDPGKYTGAYELACVVVILPGLVALGTRSEPSEILRPKLAYLGLISYGVYSLHYPLALALKGVATKLYGNDISHLTPWLGIAFLLGLVTVCGLIDKVYDSKIRALLTARLSVPIPRAARAD